MKLTKVVPSFECYKRSPYLSIKHSTYFGVYDRLFSSFVGKPITFVEVGVLNGGSLFMWREFFGDQARIIGIDLNPAAKRWEKDGFEIFIGSQSDVEFWDLFFTSVGNIDILLDDGGHTFEQQIITVESVLRHVNDDGLVVVEDTHTSYMMEYGAPSKYSFIEYSKNIIDGINHRFGRFSDKPMEEIIYSIMFFESIVAFDVSRSHSSLLSEPTESDGASVEAKDFTYADSKLRYLNEFRERLGFIKRIPIIRSIATASLACLGFIKNFRASIKLGKYFKY